MMWFLERTREPAGEGIDETEPPEKWPCLDSDFERQESWDSTDQAWLAMVQPGEEDFVTFSIRCALSRTEPDPKASSVTTKP